ncbi:hypothetical protein TIFTF001_037943 [Ficus carica]|uniref:Uncharacterized protein n=1 Tax=Ficus carica TaxID=3494 RepID=A0AA88E7Y2_FICCA|nr:hypothetical protein TIFTF001_037943 [Ficus carica]
MAGRTTPTTLHSIVVRHGLGLFIDHLYHVPWLRIKDSDNLLAIFEEMEGNQLVISIKLHAARFICAQGATSCFLNLYSWTRTTFAYFSAEIELATVVKFAPSAARSSTMSNGLIKAARSSTMSNGLKCPRTTAASKFVGFLETSSDAAL